MIIISKLKCRIKSVFRPALHSDTYVCVFFDIKDFPPKLKKAYKFPVTSNINIIKKFNITNKTTTETPQKLHVVHVHVIKSCANRKSFHYILSLN